MAQTATNVQVDSTEDLDQESLTRTDIAREALEHAGGSMMKACDALIARAKQDPQLYQLFVPDTILRDQIWLALRCACCEDREIAWHEQAEEPALPVQNGARVHLLARSNALSLLRMRLPLRHLPMLGDATKEQLHEAVTFYLQRATDMSAKGQFLSLVEKKLPQGARVREKFTEQKLREMQKTILGEVVHAA